MIAHRLRGGEPEQGASRLLTGIGPGRTAETSPISFCLIKECEANRIYLQPIPDERG